MKEAAEALAAEKFVAPNQKTAFQVKAMDKEAQKIF